MKPTTIVPCSKFTAHDETPRFIDGTVLTRGTEVLKSVSVRDVFIEVAKEPYPKAVDEIVIEYLRENKKFVGGTDFIPVSSAADRYSEILDMSEETQMQNGTFGN